VDDVGDACRRTARAEAVIQGRVDRAEVMAVVELVARASTPFSSGPASEVPSWASSAMSGTDRIGLRVMFATPFW
jgi:hypothetical protein